MKKKRTILMVFCLALASLPIAFPAYAQFEVYDGEGQYLGLSLNPEDLGETVYSPDMDSVLEIGLYGNQANIKPIGAYYKSTDCTGTPYQAYPTLLNKIYRAPCPMETFVQYDLTTAEDFVPGSLSAYDEESGQCICNDQTIFLEDTFYPLVEVQLDYTTPFALPFTFKPMSCPSEFETITADKIQIGSGPDN